MRILRRSLSARIVGLIALTALGAYWLGSQLHRLTAPDECATEQPSADTQALPSGCPPTIYFDVPYARHGDPRQVLDVYLPNGVNGPHPTLLVVHGGGFFGGQKLDLAPFARRLAQRGYAVVLVEYRLAPEHAYPAQVQDALCALGWVYANAHAYAFNPDQVVAIGESVGGSLAALLGALDDSQQYVEGCDYALPKGQRLRGVVAFYPVTNFALAAYGSFFVRYFGVTTEEAPALWAEASPLRWIDGSEPPFLVIHGSWDVRVPLSESRNLVEALQAHGVEADLVVMPQADHNFIAEAPESAASLASVDEVEDFLQGLGLRPSR